LFSLSALEDAAKIIAFRRKKIINSKSCCFT
jgi:hypothetical protein